MVRQEIWGYLLTHYAISALICTAATAAGIDPDRVKFKRTVRIARRRAADPAFSPEHARAILAQVKADITKKKHLNPGAATAPTPASSSAAATTSTASRNPATPVPATTGRPRSSSPTRAAPKQHDQHKLNGIGLWPRRCAPARDLPGPINFHPEGGRYHLDGHRKCGIRFEPSQTNAHSGICPGCGKQHDWRAAPRIRTGRPAAGPAAGMDAGFLNRKSPLPEIIGEISGSGPKSKKVIAEVDRSSPPSARSCTSCVRPAWATSAGPVAACSGRRSPGCGAAK